jgi:molybdate transport system substrate-binding protein
MKHPPLQIAWVSALALMLIACNGGPSPKEELLVGAASSLGPLLEDLAPVFKKETGIGLVFSYASAGALVRQIEQGAPLDVFASSDDARTSRLDAYGHLLDGGRRTFALGRLALVTPSGGRATPPIPADLLSEEVRFIALANPEIASYGAAAQTALQSLGFWQEVKPKIVYAQNVRQAFQFVQTGNADMGIVALSLLPHNTVVFSVLDQSLHPAIVNSVAVLEHSDRSAAALQFVQFMTGPAALEAITRHGYTLPAEGGRP